MSPSKPIWQGVYNSFNEVPIEGPGFDGQDWIINSVKKIEALRDDADGKTLVPPSSNYRECLLPLLAAMTYREQKKVRILDFGGGIGFTYYQTIGALPQTDSVEYHIIEREAVCEAGRKFFGEEHGRIFFHTHLPTARSSFDIVYIGSTLQYIEDWRHLLSQLCTFYPKYLLLVDVLAGNIPTFVTAQSYFDSKIPVWFFNIEEFIQVIAAHNYELIFKSAYLPTVFSVEQDFPMQNFDEKYRLQKSCNLLFASHMAKLG